MKKELFRAIIPSNMTINDNRNNTWRHHMGKLKWLSNLTQKALIDKVEILGFTCDAPSEKIEEYDLILEVWKCSQRFDVQNYSMTFKPIIDNMSSLGYWEDDNFKYCRSVKFTGGDQKVWNKRAYRYEGDNLPDKINSDWWKENLSNPRVDLFIRVIVEY